VTEDAKQKEERKQFLIEEYKKIIEELKKDTETKLISLEEEK